MIEILKIIIVEKLSIGIDVDKHSLKVSIVLQDLSMNRKVKGSKTFKNTKQGLKELLVWVQKKTESIDSAMSFVLEATGTYHEQLIYFLHEQSQIVHVVLSLQAKRYMQSIGHRSKNDKMDAKGLAMMGCERKLDRWQPASEHLLELRSLTRLIETLKVQRTAFQNHLEAYKHAKVVHSLSISATKKMVNELEKQIDKAEKEVALIVKNDQS